MTSYHRQTHASPCVAAVSDSPPYSSSLFQSIVPYFSFKKVSVKKFEKDFVKSESNLTKVSKRFLLLPRHRILVSGVAAIWSSGHV